MTGDHYGMQLGIRKQVLSSWAELQENSSFWNGTAALNRNRISPVLANGTNRCIYLHTVEGEWKHNTRWPLGLQTVLAGEKKSVHGLWKAVYAHSLSQHLWKSATEGKKSYLNHRYRLSHLLRTVFTARWTEPKRRAVSWSGESEFEMRFTHPAHNKLTGRESLAGDQDTVPNQHQAEPSHGWWRLNKRKAAVVTICV